jgi:hypothetical protein
VFSKQKSVVVSERINVITKMPLRLYLHPTYYKILSKAEPAMVTEVQITVTNTHKQKGEIIHEGIFVVSGYLSVVRQAELSRADTRCQDTEVTYHKERIK